MTDGNPRPEDPASSGPEASAQDDALPPPFIPGGPAPEQPPAEPPEPAPAPPEATEVEQAEPAPATASDDEEEFFPFDDSEGPAVPAAAEPEAASEAPAEPESPFEPTPREALEDEDPFPVEAFEIEGDAEETAPSPTPETAPAAGTSATEMAERLEAMAQRLRADGAAAAEAEMSAPDRFTSLLAGLLAGYLAARD